MERVARCVSNPPESVEERQAFWNDGFAPVSCDSVESFNVLMGTRSPCRSARRARRAAS